ncbi:MAG: type II toxin-antitoxin system VapC family toxin [Acidobacteria bacterium]|nr:type II toxin-antitoxin system VapC family toxin [Acidobacteriota bacterium]
MSGVVVDASVALAWGFPDEGNAYADAVLEGLEGEATVVPALWAVEIANALLPGERRQRLHHAQILRFVTLLEGLPVVQDSQSVQSTINSLLPLAREHKLSTHDTAYLDLAIREGLPLATADKRLRRAAQKSGVVILERSMQRGLP